MQNVCFMYVRLDPKQGQQAKPSATLHSAVELQTYLLLLPLALQPTVGFGLSNNVLPNFFISATISLHLLTPST